MTLVDQDGWQVFMNGRFQTFANYNDGQGYPGIGQTALITDGNGKPVELRGGGIERGDAVPEFQMGTSPTPGNQGLVRELRIRSGFTGNVLGFGVRKRLSERTEILGYSAVTVGIDSEQRRKFAIVQPDWRESFVRLTSSWGSFTAGRTLTLFSRGATEITYLYGYRYGLGFPGTVTNFSQSTAGSVGFGVLGNGFGSGLAYATPRLGGLQITVGAYDAVNFPNTLLLNRSRWPRGESEVTYENTLGGKGLVKLFVNGAYQRLYDYSGTPLETDIYGTGFGGRLELGPVRLGVAGHWGKGVGVTYSFEPHGSVFYVEATQKAMQDTGSDCGMGKISACPPVKVRTVDGGYVQTMILLTKALDWKGGAGVTRVHQLPEDVGAGLSQGDSVGYVTIKQQIGIGTGFTYHASDNFHVTLEYFRAMYQWYKPTPAPDNVEAPSQTLNVVNAGVTYDF